MAVAIFWLSPPFSDQFGRRLRATITVDDWEDSPLSRRGPKGEGGS